MSHSELPQGGELFALPDRAAGDQLAHLSANLIVDGDVASLRS
jgi:hypothetical protein